MNGAKFIPRRLSFPKLCNVLMGYLNAGADNKYVGVSEVVNKSNVTLHNISRNNNFFKSWNFLIESEKKPGKYRLSREAAEFAYAYRIDPNGKRTKEMLKWVLSKNEILTKFIGRIERENLHRDAVMVELPRVIGDLRADKVGINAFIDMISYAFQIKGIQALKRTVNTPRELKRVIKKPKKVPSRVQGPIVSRDILPISINLTLSPELPPKKIKEYIKAVLEAYQEINNNEDY